MRAKQAVWRKQLSKQCERSNKRTSEWPGTQRVDFMPFLPESSGGGLAVAMAVVHGGTKLYESTRSFLRQKLLPIELKTSERE